jgi:hypothetical protein
MNLFEWLGESFNPGPVGDIDAGGQTLFDRGIKKGWAIFFMLIGLAVLGALLWFILSGENILWSLVFLVFYLLLSYLLTPRPESSNLGWLGGLINNPFRISDNINRFLVFFYLFLLPGKLMVFAIQPFYRLLKYNLS